MASLFVYSFAILAAMDTSAIKKACEIIGGQTALAVALGISTSAVNQWVAGRRPVPPIHCPSIEKLTSGAVRCERFYPDADWAYLRGRKRKAA